MTSDAASVLARGSAGPIRTRSTTSAIRSRPPWTLTTARFICTCSTPSDPLIQAYQRLFPDLFAPASAMPADLRAHTRAPEDLFRIQAEIYRTYHMRDPDSFYNRADLWDLATSSQSQTAADGGTQSVAPVYMVLTLPGESKPEFVLTIPFTPRNKQNLIALMVTRCDGPHLGEIQFLELPKQEIINGPLQIDALVNQDQVISKDLTLWGQQGSQVLRPPILTLPIDNTFLYVEPIFIQAKQARMPQLQKVVLAVGDTLVYEDTYEKALASSGGGAAWPSSARSRGYHRGRGYSGTGARGSAVERCSDAPGPDPRPPGALQAALRARQAGRGRQGARSHRAVRRKVRVLGAPDGQGGLRRSFQSRS